MTHFELFELPQRYELELETLEQRYRELSLQRHPDRVAKGDPRARRVAVEQTTALNDAYKVLKDPLRRAFYLLKLAGVDLDRDDAGTQKEMPLEFLEEVMELREELAQARAAKDLPRAQQMGSQVEARRKAALDEAVKQLKALEERPHDAQAIQKAAHQLGRVRYFTRFLEEVDLIEEEALG